VNAVRQLVIEPLTAAQLRTLSVIGRRLRAGLDLGGTPQRPAQT